MDNSSTRKKAQRANANPGNSLPAEMETTKAGRRGELTPLEEETKAKMMLSMGYTAGGTARRLGLPKTTVRGIEERMTATERKEWSQRYRTWAANELLPEVQDRLMDALPNAKAWELNNILGTAFDKLCVLEGRPTEIHGQLIEGRVEIWHMVQRLGNLLPSMPSGEPQLAADPEKTIDGLIEEG